MSTAANKATEEPIDAFLGGEAIEEDFSDLDLGNEVGTSAEDFDSDEPMESTLEEIAGDVSPEEEAEEDTEEEETTEESEVETEKETEKETEEDREVEEETAQADTDDPDPQETAKKIQIPKSRFDKEVQKRKDLERQIRDMQKAQQPATQPKELEIPKVDVTESTTAALEKALDGDAKGAAEILSQAINEAADAKTKAIAENLQQQAKADTQQIISANTMEARVDAVISNAEEAYAVFNQDSDSFDPDVVNKALAFQAGYMDQQGMSPDLALQEGIQDALRLTHPELLEAAPAAGPKPAPEPKPTKQKAKVSEKEITKKAKLAEKQPGNLTGRTDREVPSVPDIFNMTDEDFDNLTDEDLRKLRGDDI